MLNKEIIQKYKNIADPKDDLQQLIGSVLLSLMTDLPPRDNNLTLDLNEYGIKVNNFK